MALAALKRRMVAVAMPCRANRIALAILLPTVAVAGVTGCYVQEVVIERPFEDAGADGGEADAGDDGDSPDASEEDAGPSCSGDCAPINHPDFDLPMLFWFGAPNQIPECPDRAPVRQDLLHADLVIPADDCEPCNCKPSTGSCGLPETLTAHAGICYAGAADTSFDPPPDWDGSCTAVNSIPAQAQCPPGSGIPCVQSITIGALAKLDEKCEPDLPPVPKVTNFSGPSWGLAAISCQGYTNPPLAGCEDPGRICVPAADPDAGFRQCIRARGDMACPGQAYSKKFVFYEGYEDQRACTACTCGAPMDSVCTAFVSVFKDASCTDPVIPGVPASSDDPPCLDLTPKGQPLGSKSVSGVTYHPGTCEAGGGEIEGTVVPVRPITFCCQS